MPSNLKFWILPNYDFLNIIFSYIWPTTRLILDFFCFIHTQTQFYTCKPEIKYTELQFYNLRAPTNAIYIMTHDDAQWHTRTLTHTFRNNYAYDDTIFKKKIFSTFYFFLFFLSYMTSKLLTVKKLNIQVRDKK